MNWISCRSLNRFPQIIVLLLCIGCALGYANAQGRRSLKQAKPAVTQTYTQTVLHQFGSAQLDGVYPSGGLIKDNDGNFYGATSNGGQIGLGSVFEFTPSSSGGTYNAIYSSQYGPCDYYISFLSIDSLGNLYYKGQGVPQDDAQAATWFRKAAEQGDAGAQYNLGGLYFWGRGVPQDYAEAYFWLDVAVAGNLDAFSAEWIAKYRDEAASHLTPADLFSVQKRARKWFEEHQAKP